MIDHPRPNHRKNRQAPKPPIQQPKSLDESVLNSIVESTSNLEIRAPSELLLGFPTGLRTQWRHAADRIITGSVKYEVNVRAMNCKLRFSNRFFFWKIILQIVLFSFFYVAS